MFKKMIALMLCLCVCAVPAFAAMGRVGSAAALQSRSLTFPYGQGCDYTAAWASAEELSVSKSYVKNIFAQAKAVDKNTGSIYKTKSSTQHYVSSTSILTDEVERNWNLSQIAVQAQGLARTRYTDESVSESTSRGTVAYIGGENLRSVSGAAENQSIRTSESDNWIGYGQGNEMVGVIQSVFGYDLSNYAYLSHGELWDKGRGEVEPEFKALFGLVTDLFVNAQEGEKLPLGYLYRGNTVYTVVEQADGSLNLTRYQLNPSADAQMNSAETLMGEADIPHYCVVEVENAVVSRNVLDALYE